MNLKRNRKFASVPLFSTSDIAFLLLIFIMLVSLINYRVSVPIEFAEAESGLRTSAEKNMEIWIDINGFIYIDGHHSDHITLRRKIADLHTEAPDTRVHILADRNLTYDKINGVLEILQVMQYRVVSFVVKTNE